MRSKETPTESTALHVRDYRIRAGLTVRMVAAEAGISIGYLSRVERGVQAAPDSTISAIGQAIGRLAARGGRS